MKRMSKEDLLPIFFGLSACSWMPHWACHYYRLETGTSFVVGSWSFSTTESALSLAIYGILILANLLCVVFVKWRFQVSLVTGVLHLLIGSVHVVRLWSPFRFEVFGYEWSYAASLREVIIVVSYGIVCLVVAWKLYNTTDSTAKATFRQTTAGPALRNRKILSGRTENMYIRIWRFRPHPQKIKEFRTVYGPDGDWSRLFRSARGFIDTELVQSSSDSTEYLTIDRWTDSQSWEASKVSHARPYRELDKRCEALTMEEGEVGAFSTPAA